MRLWDTWRQPPKSALKTIRGGRLKGMTDIKPVWRMQVLTEQLGPCGIGWYYDITRQWTEQGSDGQITAHTNVDLFIKVDGEWSKPISGTGGSMLVEKETRGLHTSDEAFKMSLTDALSVACLRLGIAADIYLGAWDGSKYNVPAPKASKSSNILDRIHDCKTPEALLKMLNDWSDSRPIEENIKNWDGIFKMARAWVDGNKWDYEDLNVWLSILEKAVGNEA